MVQNPNTGSPTDLLQAVGLPTTEPITRKLTEEEARGVLDETGPDSSRRRTGFYAGQHRAWWIYVLQYMGFQTNQSLDLMETSNVQSLMVDGAYVANHILRYVTTNVARKSQQRPSWSVIPNTPDLRDQFGAKVGQSLLDYAYDHLDMYRKSLERNLWLETCGTAFDFVDWAHSKGTMRRVYHDPLRGVPIDTRQLGDQEKQFLDSLGAYKEVSDGDWEYEILSPFQVYLPAYAKTMEQASWVRFDRVFAFDEVWDRWPDMAKDIGPQDDWSSDTQTYWRRLATMSNRNGDSLIGGAAQSEGLLVSTVHVRPSKWFPAGLTVVGTKTKVLYHGPHQDKERGLDTMHPLVDFHHTRVPGRFWSMGMVEHLIAAQNEHNRSRDQMNAQRDILGTAQWLAPQGSLKGPTRNEAGDIWEYDPNMGAPTLVQPPMLSPAIVESGAGAMQDMQLMAAQSDPTQGNVPQGVRSGIAIRALQEKDSMVMAPSIADLEKGTERVGARLLKLSHKLMKFPRAISIYGESRQADIVWFKGSDLNGNTTVRIRPGSMTPRSKAESMQQVMDLLQLGALNPANPQHLRVIIETMEVGGTDRFFLLENLQRRRARHENLMFAFPPQDDPNYQFPDVDVDDDHAAHLEEHLQQKLTDEYERWPPIRKMLFSAHMEKHQMALAQMLEAQVAMQQAGGGGGGSDGGGSPPKEPGEASKPRERQPTPGSEPVNNP